MLVAAAAMLVVAEVALAEDGKDFDDSELGSVAVVQV